MQRYEPVQRRDRLFTDRVLTAFYLYSVDASPFKRVRRIQIHVPVINEEIRVLSGNLRYPPPRIIFDDIFVSFASFSIVKRMEHTSF